MSFQKRIRHVVDIHLTKSVIPTPILNPLSFGNQRSLHIFIFFLLSQKESNSTQSPSPIMSPRPLSILQPTLTPIFTFDALSNARPYIKTENKKNDSHGKWSSCPAVPSKNECCLQTWATSGIIKNASTEPYPNNVIASPLWYHHSMTAGNCSRLHCSLGACSRLCNQRPNQLRNRFPNLCLNQHPC